MRKYQQHPLSSVFPAMSAEAFKELIDDIDRNGVREKIVTYEGKILDGWHRYSACLELNVVNPPMIEYDGNDPGGYVLSKNLYRRHLNPSDRSFTVAEVVTWQEGSGRRSKNVEAAQRIGSIDPISSLSIPQAAKLAGVSEPTMKRAKKATKAIPEVKKAVLDGEMKVYEAAQIADLAPEKQLEYLQSRKEPKKRAPKDSAFELLNEAYKELEEKYAELASELEHAMKELAAVEALRANVQVQEIMKLHAQLRSMTEARDQWQNKCAELQKQINYMKKK